ncbi:hypothetical protein A0H81_08989 [Grifola frondosa]|uniref:Uncharacterized protein n=1 Tax=Grifola frondosa TaxID=5627 RepID=A0A1C7M3T6_GRIFR|nr:hypothetical protein A0H81_08989 [Grifola frondosa]
MPGLLGRPWQWKNEFSLSHKPEGVFVGLRDYHGVNTYEILITSPGIQKAVLDRTLRLCALLSAEQNIENPNAAETQRLEQQLSDLLKRGSEEIPVYRWEATDGAQLVGPTDINDPKCWNDDYNNPPESENSKGYTEYDRWIEIENQRLYHNMRTTFQFQIGQAVDDVAFPITHISAKNARTIQEEPGANLTSVQEQQYLLQDVKMTVNGRQREGHAVLHMVFAQENLREPQKDSTETNVVEIVVKNHEPELIKVKDQASQTEEQDSVDKDEPIVCLEEDLYTKWKQELGTNNWDLDNL